MRVVCVIPARIGSTRLPEKPLSLIGGEPLIRRVASRVLEAGFADRVVVATDDARVVSAVDGLEVYPELTRSDHRSGTERVAEVARLPAYRQADLIVNVQGDEPFLPRRAMHGPLDGIMSGAPLATTACPLGKAERDDPDVVKVTVDAAGRAVAFGRTLGEPRRGTRAYRHVGVYAYRREALLRWVEAAPAPAEIAQRLEQLRPHEAGESFTVTVLSERVPPGVDTPADLIMAQRLFDDSLERATA